MNDVTVRQSASLCTSCRFINFRRPESAVRTTTNEITSKSRASTLTITLLSDKSSQQFPVKLRCENKIGLHKVFSQLFHSYIFVAHFGTLYLCEKIKLAGI